MHAQQQAHRGPMQTIAQKSQTSGEKNKKKKHFHFHMELLCKVEPDPCLLAPNANSLTLFPSSPYRFIFLLSRQSDLTLKKHFSQLQSICQSAGTVANVSNNSLHSFQLVRGHNESISGLVFVYESQRVFLTQLTMSLLGGRLLFGRSTYYPPTLAPNAQNSGASLIFSLF